MKKKKNQKNKKRDPRKEREEKRTRRQESPGVESEAPRPGFHPLLSPLHLAPTTQHWATLFQIISSLCSISGKLSNNHPSYRPYRLVMAFPVVMYGCESWTINKAECQRIDAFELWCWGRLLRVP